MRLIPVQQAEPMRTLSFLSLTVVATLATTELWAQTQIDLRTQSKSVDFSAAGSTKPIRMGSALPATCSLGEMFFLNVAVPGHNLFLCTATNSWTMIGGGTVTNTSGTLTANYPLLGAGGSDIKVGAKTGSGTEVVMSDSPTIITPFIDSFVNATHTHNDTAGGGLLSSAAIASAYKQGNGTKFLMFGGSGSNPGDCAQFDDTGSVISSSAPCGEANTVQNVGSGTFFWFKQKVGSTLQLKTFAAGSKMSISEAGDVITFNVNEGALELANLSGLLPSSKLLAGIDATKIGLGTVNNTKFSFLSNVTSDVQSQLNAKAPLTHSHSTGGDATGELANLVVTGLQGRPVASTPPLTGQVLTWNGTLSRWEPQFASAGVSSFNGRGGAVVPATGDYSFSQISGTVAPSQLASGIDVTKLGSGTVNDTKFGYLANVTSDLQTQLNSKANSSHSHSVNGDLAGDISAATVVALRNRSVAATAPSNGNVLTWNAVSNQWEPQAPPAGGSSGVISFNGRTGAVSPSTGDYSFSQLSGTVANTQLAAGIDAAKIGPGTVNNTTFGYLANVTSDVQAQLNAKAATSHSHSASGDAIGDLSSLSVVKLRNRAVAATAPQNGQALVWNAMANQWEPQNQAGSGTNATQLQGRNVSALPPTDGQVLAWSTAQNSWLPAPATGVGGVNHTAQLTDLIVERTTSTTLTIGASCSPTTPCKVRFGSNTLRIVQGAVATLLSGSGLAKIYISPDGSIRVGHPQTMTVACSDCIAVTPLVNLPSNSIPIWEWQADASTWQLSGGTDLRAFLGVEHLAFGTGLTTVTTGGATTVALDTALVGLRVGVPSTSSTACNPGEWALNSSHVYFCVAPATWRRTALSAW